MQPEGIPGQEAAVQEAAEFSRHFVAAGHDGLVAEYPFRGREVVVFELATIRMIGHRLMLGDRSAALR